MPRSVRCPDPDAPTEKLLVFAGRYNGYARLANDPQRLQAVVADVLRALDSTERCPEWAGLDLLRGALFYIDREAHHFGELTRERERHVRQLVSAIQVASRGGLLSNDMS